MPSQVDLENMRKLDRAVLTEIRFNPDTKVFTFEYQIQAADGRVMYAEGCAKSFAKEGNINTWTIAELIQKALAAVTEHAQGKYGKPKAAVVTP